MVKKYFYNLSYSFLLTVYIYIYIYVCVCVCVYNPTTIVYQIEWDFYLRRRLKMFLLNE